MLDNPVTEHCIFWVFNGKGRERTKAVAHAIHAFLPTPLLDNDNSPRASCHMAMTLINLINIKNKNIMSNKNLFFMAAAALAASASIVSCSHENVLDETLGGRTPIMLTSDIALTRVTDQTLQNTQIANGVRVGVFVQPATDGGELIADNAALTANGNGGFTGDPIYYPADGSAVSIYAYAPYNADWNSSLNTDKTFIVSADQSAEKGFTDSDLLRGVPTNNSLEASNDAVPIIFKHKLTKLNINFDTSDSDVDLKGAEVSILNTALTTTFNVYSGAVGVASGDVTEIKVASFANDAASFTASAVIVPQTISANTELVRVTLANSSTVIEAKLNQEVTFESGKKYTYTVKLGGTSSDPTAKLIPGSSITEWEDGNKDFVSQYGVGDFILADGSFLKADEATAENTSDVRAVIFSTDVTATDSAEGYGAYAMNITPSYNKIWGSEAVTINTGTGDFTEALADMDGRSKTAAVLESETYNSLEDKTSTIFECLGRVTTVDNKNVVSAAFVPSFGQWIAFLNNLGDAGITASTQLGEDSNWNALWTSADNTVIETINQYMTDHLGKTILGTNNIYLSVTESDQTAKFWAVQTSSDAWKFGKNPGKGVSRTTLTCIAVKLPTVQLEQSSK